MSALNITGAGAPGSAANTQFNNIKTYQFTEKFSWFKGRHAMKFGGRWLYQRQGFSYSGNEGSLGHFDYTGAFTGLGLANSGFGFADFLLDAVSAKGLGGLVEPFTQLAHRVGIFAQDDFRVSNDLTLNLGLTWEYLSPWVEKDDRQSNIDLTTGQLLLAGQNGASRALYDPYYGGWEPRVGAAWSPTDELGRSRRLRHRPVHGGHRQEPAAHAEPALQLRRQTRVRCHDRSWLCGGRLRGHHPQHEWRPRDAVSHLRA